MTVFFRASEHLLVPSYNTYTDVSSCCCDVLKAAIFFPMKHFQLIYYLLSASFCPRCLKGVVELEPKRALSRSRAFLIPVTLQMAGISTVQLAASRTAAGRPHSTELTLPARTPLMGFNVEHMIGSRRRRSLEIMKGLVTQTHTATHDTICPQSY